MLEKLKTLWKIRCRHCKSICNPYVPKNKTVKFPVCFRCPKCKSEFLLETKTIIFFMVLVIIFRVVLEFWGAGLFEWLLMPLVDFCNKYQLGQQTFFWIAFIALLIFTCMLALVLIVIGKKLIRFSLVEVVNFEPEQWVRWNQSSPKGEFKKAWADIKAFPIWQKIISIFMIVSLIVFIWAIYYIGAS